MELLASIALGWQVLSWFRDRQNAIPEVDAVPLLAVTSFCYLCLVYGCPSLCCRGSMLCIPDVW